MLLLLLVAGLFDVSKALAMGVKVGLGTDIAGGYSPSMLQAQRMAVVNSHALKAAALMYGNWRAQEQQQQQQQEADSTSKENCKKKEKEQQQQGGGHQEQEEQQHQQQEEPGHSNKQLQQATASTAGKVQCVVSTDLCVT
jgi:hypothetical protein